MKRRWEDGLEQEPLCLSHAFRWRDHHIAITRRVWEATFLPQTLVEIIGNLASSARISVLQRKLRSSCKTYNVFDYELQEAEQDAERVAEQVAKPLGLGFTYSADTDPLTIYTPDYSEFVRDVVFADRQPDLYTMLVPIGSDYLLKAYEVNLVPQNLYRRVVKQMVDEGGHSHAVRTVEPLDVSFASWFVGEHVASDGARLCVSQEKFDNQASIYVSLEHVLYICLQTAGYLHVVAWCSRTHVMRRLFAPLHVPHATRETLWCDSPIAANERYIVFPGDAHGYERPGLNVLHYTCSPPRWEKCERLCVNGACRVHRAPCYFAPACVDLLLMITLTRNQKTPLIHIYNIVQKRFLSHVCITDAERETDCYHRMFVGDLPSYS